MKKLIAGIGIAALACGCSCGNMDMFDTNYTFNKAVIRWPDGTAKEIKIKQWADYEGEQIQIIAEDGKVYLISMNNAILIRDKN